MKLLPLSWQLAIAFLAGLAAAPLLGSSAALLKPLADLFIAALTAAGPPVALFAFLASLAALSSRRLARIGLRALLWFLLSAFAASAIGIGFAAALDVGSGFTSTSDAARSGPPPPFTGEIRAFGDFVRGPASHIMFWTALALLLFRRSKSADAADTPLVKRAFDCSIRILGWIMVFAPAGVFALAAVTFATTSLGAAMELLAIIAATYVGQLLVTGLTILVLLVAGVAPLAFVRQSSEALITAFVTGSSAATAPVEIATAERLLKVDSDLLGLVLPLGLAIYKIGSAVLLAVALVFATRAGGGELTMTSMTVLALLAAFASVITPPISGGVLVALGVTSGIAGLPLSLLVLAATVPFAGKLNTPLNSLGRLASVKRFDQRELRRSRSGQWLTASGEERLADPGWMGRRGQEP